jgi:AraC-like DNA-binding protein
MARLPALKGVFDPASVAAMPSRGLTPADKVLTLSAMAAKSRIETLHGAVPAAYVRLLYQHLERLGLDSRKLLREAEPQGERYPVLRWRRLLERASAHLGDPQLGLRLGRSITPAHLGVMGYVLLACGSLGAALERLRQYQRLVYDVNPMRQRLEGASVVLEWGTEQGRPGPLVDETAIAALVQMARDLSGKRFAPERVCFVNAPPPSLKPYRDWFGCPVRFGHPQTELRFAARLLALPLRQPDAALLALLQRQADALMGELSDGGDLEQSVRRCIARLTREGEPALKRVAAELHTTPRTLHRRLQQRSQSFRALREDTRRRLAEEYLNDPRLRLAEIAQLLGFSEQSAFNRSFRRWTGRTPGAFRLGMRSAAR